MTMTDDLARIAEVLEDNASRAKNAVQRQIMTSNAAVVRDAKARIEALTADNARLRNSLTGIKRAAAHRMQDDPKDLHSYYFYTADAALTGKAEQAVAGPAPVTTADMVKDLREKTGAGMVDAKRALTECLGDMDEAVEWLRFKGTSRTYTPKHKRLQAVAALTGKEPSHE